MPNIQVLDQSTINKIAAGEVIERPASVVKELLENAIDARASAVTVEIKDGGTTFIRVTDNGCGIPREEVALAFLRHSTSKIKSVEDLFTVSSLGFRGEALASIAAVSQVELITKTSVGLTGSRYRIEGGEERGLEEIGAPEGTTFIARNLFYNTPARRKFLKTPMTEGAHVADLVEKIALSHPEVSIRFIQNNQNKLHTSGNHNLKDIIYTVFGREIAANLLAVEVKKPIITIDGYIGKPVIARGNRNYENYFINGRYIRSNIISKAIEEAYKPYMMQHKYPFTMLHFTIEPELLDVNVHPTKMELRFRDGEMVYRTVFDAVSGALAHKELIPEVQLNKSGDDRTLKGAKVNEPHPEPFEKNRIAALSGNRGGEGYAIHTSKRIQPEQPAFLREGDELGEKWVRNDGTAANGSGQWNRMADQLMAGKQPVGRNEAGTAGKGAANAADGHGNTQGTAAASVPERNGSPYSSESETKQAVALRFPQKQNSVSLQESLEQQESLQQQDSQQLQESRQQQDLLQPQDSLQQQELLQPQNSSQSQDPLQSQNSSQPQAPLQSPKSSLPQNSAAPSSVGKPEQLDLFDGKLLEPKSRALHKLIGQLFDTYWLVEFNEQLYIIDQHAAHEKVLYEKTMATIKNREYASQMVDPPIILTLNMNEEVLLKSHLKYFTDIGFEIEPFGGREYAVRGVPANLLSVAKKELLIEMIDGLSEEGAGQNPDIIYERVASMSCKAAVKGGNRLSVTEANELIDQLLNLENPYACPHGRPTIISMSKYELEKKFKRIV